MKTILWILLTGNLGLFAQPAIQWKYSYGGANDDQPFAIHQTTDGGYIAAGRSWSNDSNVIGNHGFDDVWIIKIDPMGSMEWQKSLGGSQSEGARSIFQTNDGGYFIGGYTFSNNGNVSGNHGLSDYWVIKTDGSGNIEWQKCLGGTGWDACSSVEQTSDGGYIAAGHSESNNGDVSGNHGSDDFWIVKLDSTGGIQWQKSLGGTGDEWAESIHQTSDGGYIATGFTNSGEPGDVSGNNGANDYWTVKLDANGNIQWQKCLGGNSNDWSSDVHQTSDGGYIVAGHAGSNNGDVSGNHGGSEDAWVVKLDNSGNIQWQKCFGGTNTDYIYSIQNTSDGGYIAAGFTGSSDGDVTNHIGGSDFWILKLDNTGTILWQKCMGGTGWDDASSIQPTMDGGYIVAGWAASNDVDITDNHGYWDYWIVKFNGTLGEQPIITPLTGIYPNPCSDFLKIPIDEVSEISLVNINGRVMINQIINPGDLISLQEFAPGMYTVFVVNSKRRSAGKVVIQQ